MGDLTDNFSRSEFACQCGCGFDKIEPAFVAKLQKLRDKIGRIKIISGCRCKKHNKSKAVQGSKNSRHLVGIAADIAPLDVPMWVAVLAAERFGFTGMGFGATKLHLDDRPIGETTWWIYKNKRKEEPSGKGK